MRGWAIKKIHQPLYYNDNNIKAAKIIYHAYSGIAL
jgi:hypothetical protein